MPETGESIGSLESELQSIRNTGRPRETHLGKPNPAVTTLNDVRKQIAQQNTDDVNTNVQLRFADARSVREKPTGLKRILSLVGRAVSEVSVHDEKVPTEDLDERTVAYLILTGQQNITDRTDKTSINPFNTVDILRNAGYIGLTPESTDYEGKWPTQYARTHQVLRSLHDIGAIEFLSPETAESDPDPGYTVKPEQMRLLYQVATRANEVSPRFSSRGIPPIKG